VEVADNPTLGLLMCSEAKHRDLDQAFTGPALRSLCQNFCSSFTEKEREELGSAARQKAFSLERPASWCHGVFPTIMPRVSELLMETMCLLPGLWSTKARGFIQL
jgi:hypothetical protein